MTRAVGSDALPLQIAVRNTYPRAKLQMFAIGLPELAIMMLVALVVLAGAVAIFLFVRKPPE